MYWGACGGASGEEPAGDVRATGSIPGWGRCPGGGKATYSSILAWRTPQTEEPGRLQSMSHKESDMTEALTTFTFLQVEKDSYVLSCSVVSDSL